MEGRRVNVYLDIETMPGEKPSLESIVPDARLKDEEKIKADKIKKHDSVWRKQSLDPLVGEVFCVGLATNNEEPFVIVGSTERETMEMFEDELQKYSFPRIISHNGFGFDYVWLFYKGLKYGLSNIVATFGVKDRDTLLDTMVMMKGTDYKAMISLDNMCRLLGFPAKDGITGADVFDLLQAGKGHEVCEYCKNDVAVLRKAYNILSSYGLG